ncbi:hypothetical protein B0T10DRAFT_584653 [Thelonectria olida]|uniref:Heterokaryon incompatibility domain-containing protein n=1 Tax=Thelonectria olida TaxID=1576542 RepID=A0A9P8VXF2_9HYPO|nr:hypothetical protein B0T10DRAFT_584653 [Thelonectria olida]
MQSSYSLPHRETRFHSPIIRLGRFIKGNEITVNGKAVTVTASLGHALQWAKHHWQKRFPGRDGGEFRLWADALCINQGDIDERNHQVQLMRDIYPGAELTLSQISINDSVICHALKVYNQIHAVLSNGNPKVTLRELADCTWLRKIPSPVYRD